MSTRLKPLFPPTRRFRSTYVVKYLRSDNRAVRLAAEYRSYKQMEKQSSAEADAIKAELLEKLGEAGTGLLDSFTVKAPTVKATPDKEITADMVGSIIKGRKSYRRFTITEKSHD